MSVVTVQLGQCGNQIGGQFFSTIIDDLQGSNNRRTQNQLSGNPECTAAQNREYCEVSIERFFSQSETVDGSEPLEKRKLKARSVMVDMEPKVIAQTVMDAKKTGLWSYPEKAQFCQKRGSGNNWAHGFCVHGPQSSPSILDLVSREAERCDRLGGFVALLSLAGGTGSGVGTYVTQALRDEYPHAFIVNQVVSPHSMGEVIVQNYNAMLTLSHLYQCSDAILTLENDILQKICSQLLNIHKVSFSDINKVVGHKMAGILQPCFQEGENTVSRDHIGELLSHLVSQPEYKLLTMSAIPQMSETSMQYSSYQWRGLVKHLRQMLIANAPMEEGIDWQVKASPHSTDFNRSIANLVFLRGRELQDADAMGLRDRYLYTSWMPPAHTCQIWTHPRTFRNYEKSAALLSNSQAPVESLDRIVGKAWRMFSSRAYVHQYFKHGLVEDDFMDCFAAMEQIIHSYKQL